MLVFLSPLGRGLRRGVNLAVKLLEAEFESASAQDLPLTQPSPPRGEG
jgi:hypothetical protein